jgi:hypothetical protein
MTGLFLSEVCDEAFYVVKLRYQRPGKPKIAFVILFAATAGRASIGSSTADVGIIC